MSLRVTFLAVTMALVMMLAPSTHAQTGLSYQWIYSPIFLPVNVAYSPDSSLFAIGGSGGIQIYSASTQSLISCISTGYGTGGVAFLPDGKTLASISGSLICFWDIATGNQINTFSSTGGSIAAFAISADGAEIAACENSYTISQGPIAAVETWDINSGTLLASRRMVGVTLSGIAYSPDGASIALGATYGPGILQIVSASNLVTLSSFPTSAQGISSVAFSPDGKTLADSGLVWRESAQGEFSVLELWNVSTATQVAVLKSGLDSISDVSFSSDGKWLAVGGATNGVTGGVELWDSATLTLTQTLVGNPSGAVNALQFSPNGRTIAAIQASQTPSNGQTYYELDMWSIANGKLITALTTEAYSSATGLALAPDGNTIAVSGTRLNIAESSQDGWIGLWDTASGVLRSSLTPNGAPTSVQISPDGKLLADCENPATAYSSSSPLLEIWDLQKGTLVRSFNLTLSRVNSIAFSADSATLLAGGSTNDWNGTTGALQIYSVATGKLIANLPTNISQQINAVACSPDGSTIAACGSALCFLGYYYGMVEIWDAKLQTLITSLDTSIFDVNTVAFSPDGKTLADGGVRISELQGSVSGIELWNLSNGALLSSFPSLIGASPIDSLTFSPAGVTLFAGSYNNLTAFNTATYAILGNYPGTGVTASGISPDGSRLALLTASGTVAVASNPLNLNVPIASVTVNPTTLVGGYLATGTVTLAEPAPASGVGVKLTSNNLSATVPEFVEFLPGATTATFTVTTTGVAALTTAVITAGVGATAATTTLTINPTELYALSAGPPSTQGGEQVIGFLVLNGEATAGGIVVSLKCNNPAASVPASVTIPAGRQAVDFTITTKGVTTVQTVTLVGTCQGVTLTANFKLYPNTLSSLGINPYFVPGGTTANGEFSLWGKAPAGGLTLKLSSDTSGVTVPTSVFVPEGKSAGTFWVRTNPVATPVTATITVLIDGTSSPTSLIVTPPVLTSFSLKPNAVKGGTDTIGTVKIGSPAPHGGLVISLSSSSPSATVPSKVIIPAGSTSATVKVQTAIVSVASTATIKASIAGGTQTASLVINPS